VVVISRESANIGELMSAADLACTRRRRREATACNPEADDSEVSAGAATWNGRPDHERASRKTECHLLVQPAKALRGNLAISEYQEVLLRMSDESGKLVPTMRSSALLSATT